MRKQSALIFLFLIFSAGPLWAGGEGPEPSGLFQELTLGVDAEKGALTGYYENGSGWDPQTQQPRFNCIFYLYGKKEGGKYPIQTWFPGDQASKQVIAGELRFLPPEKGQSSPSVHLRLFQEPGGCGNVNPALAQPEGDRLFLETPGEWREVRVVSAQKARFYETADPGAAKKAYVVRGDGLRVFEKKLGWVKADFQGKAKGWVRETDLFSSNPPR